MIAYAAIDLHDGQVVQLVGGDTDEARVVLDDPVAVARSWIDQGFRALHIVDLDAALGTGDNRDIVRAIFDASNVPVQIGGGIRADEDVAYWIDAGAEVVIGTRAFRDRPWLERITALYPQRIVVAADVRDGMVATHGWRSSSEVPVREYVRDLNALPLRSVLVTDIGREGSLAGADFEMFRTLASDCSHPLVASGGVGGTADLAELEKTGVAGVVLGMALYTGHIDTRVVAQEFSK